MEKFPKADTTNTVQKTLDDELLLYNLVTNKAVCLNQTSASVYNLCNGINSIDSIADKTHLPKEIVILAIGDLSKHNLLTEKINIESSRRNLLKSLVLSSVALPVTTIVVAPVAARAGSICGTVPSGDTFSIPNNGGGTSSCFTAANDAQCQSCRVSSASCSSPACTTINCTCR